MSGSVTRNYASSGESNGSLVGTAAGTVTPPSDLPLSAARRRLEAASRTRLKRRRKYKKAVELRAQGDSVGAIAQYTALSRKDIVTFLARPENKAMLAQVREAMRAGMAQRALRTLDPAWDLVDDTVAQKDAKGFDAATRGLHAVEKIAASVSGENQRVQVEHVGHVEVDHRVELRALLASITGYANTGYANTGQA